MKKLFKHIRSQPKAKRDSYALMVAGTFTGIVALVWAISLPAKMGTVAGSIEAESDAPFASFFDEAGEQLAAVKDSFESGKAELDQVKSATTTNTAITLSPEEIEAAKAAIENNATTSTETAATTSLPTPVMIATTSTTTTYSASSTP